MEQSELDLMLELLENPVRRRIVKRLSQEPGYSLQLAKELGLGQQLIASHLQLMEHAGLVESSREASPSGPNRREFLLRKSLSVTIDVAPHLFNVRMKTLDQLPKGEFSGIASSFKQRVDRILEQPDDRKRLSDFSKFFSEIDKKIAEFEDARSALLNTRNYAMELVSETLSRSERTPEERRLLYQIMNEDDRAIERLSENLNIREGVIRQLLKELQEDLS
jgi:predicted transcriptional regulator